MNRSALKGAAAAVTCLVFSSCADTVNPNRGGLRLGLEDGPLRPPAAIKGDVFEFPRSAWEDGIGGTTVLKIRIDIDGTIDSTIVLQSSGYPILDSAAVANSSKLLYRPAEQAGEPVPIWGRLPVIYPLPGEATADVPKYR
ncbi:MAG: energy transducer TonB [Gemmatimonadota bacterium]